MRDGRGWHYYSYEHGLAARGIKSTVKRIPRVKYPETHVEEIMGGTMYFLRNDHWICQLDNGRDIHLGLVLEIIDMKEVDAKYDDEEYPVTVEAQIMVVPEEMSKKYKVEVSSGDITPDEVTIYDAVSYSGGIPATAQLEGISSSRKSSVESKPVTEKDGRGWTWHKRYFKTADDAETYIREIYSDHADTLLGIFIGFTLDQSINLIGTTGWDIIKYQKKGIEWIR